MHIYTYTCRIHIDAMKKTSEDFFKKIYLSLYLKGSCVRGSCNILTHTLMANSVVSFTLSRAAQPEFQGPSPLGAGLSTASCHQRVGSPKLTDFLSSPSYIIVQSPTQSLEWHV